MTHRKFLYFFSFILSISSLLAYEKEDEAIKACIENNLPTHGILTQNIWGGLYVKLDDRYIDILYPYIEHTGFEKPFHKLKGAHITVVMAPECRIDDVDEVGMQIPFKIKGCEIVKPNNWSGMSFVYIITLDAPVLDAIREKYGFPKAPHDFHITIGLKK